MISDSKPAFHKQKRHDVYHSLATLPAHPFCTIWYSYYIHCRRNNNDPLFCLRNFIQKEEMQQSYPEQDVQKVLMWTFWKVLYVCICQWAIMIRVGIIMLIALQERLDVLCNYMKCMYRYLHLQPARMSWENWLIGYRPKFKELWINILNSTESQKKKVFKKLKIFSFSPTAAVYLFTQETTSVVADHLTVFFNTASNPFSATFTCI